MDLLKKRKVDTELNIVIKDPGEHTFDHVLDIINKIGEGRGNAAQTNSSKNFIRSCYRRMENNRGVAEGILALVPTDI